MSSAKRVFTGSCTAPTASIVPFGADRHEPVYSRAVELPHHQRSMFDSLLEERGVTFL